MKKIAWIQSVLAIACGFAMIEVPMVHAQDLVIHAAAGVKSPLEALAREYASHSANHWVLHFDTAGAALANYLADDRASAVITTQTRMESALQNGKLHEGAMHPFAATVAGIAGADFKGTVPKNAQELKALFLSSQSIAVSDPARGATVGQHFMDTIERLGIKENIMPKVKLARDGLQTMEWVEDKKVELAVTQMSEIMQSDASTLIGPFPHPFELNSQYSIWLKDPHSEASEALLNWLKSASVQSLLVSQGLRP